MSSWVLSISKDGDSLADLCQGLTTLIDKKVSLLFKQDFLHFGLCPWLYLLYPSPSDI